LIFTVTLNTAVDRTIEVENFEPSSVNTGKLVRLLPAGKGVNVSRMLSTLGVESVAMGYVGTRQLHLYEDSLKDSLVEIDFVVLDAPTRENVTIVDPSREVETHIRERGPRIERTEIHEMKRKIEHRIHKGDKVVFSGSIPYGVSRKHFRDMLKMCSGVGADLFLDAGGATLRECADLADYIKPNIPELQQALRTESEDMGDLLTLLRKFRMHEPALLTCGEKGAYYVESDICYHASADMEGLVPISTVGCGDAFLAGFVHGMDKGEKEGGCLRAAVAAATACLLSPTADIDSADMVSQLANRVTAKRL
jgi:1-phosphofructokinase